MYVYISTTSTSPNTHKDLSYIYAHTYILHTNTLLLMSLCMGWVGLGGGVAGGQQGADARFHSDQVDGQQRAVRAGYSRGETT